MLLHKHDVSGILLQTLTTMQRLSCGITSLSYRMLNMLLCPTRLSLHSLYQTSQWRWRTMWHLHAVFCCVGCETVPPSLGCRPLACPSCVAAVVVHPVAVDDDAVVVRVAVVQFPLGAPRRCGGAVLWRVLAAEVAGGARLRRARHRRHKPGARVRLARRRRQAASWRAARRWRPRRRRGPAPRRRRRAPRPVTRLAAVRRRLLEATAQRERRQVHVLQAEAVAVRAVERPQRLAQLVLDAAERSRRRAEHLGRVQRLRREHLQHENTWSTMRTPAAREHIEQHENSCNMRTHRATREHLQHENTWHRQPNNCITH